MSLSLYQAIIPSYLQIVSSVAVLLDKAEAFCSQQGLPPETLIQARLAEDMRPFAFQISSVARHSLGAIEGASRGVFSPETTPPPENFAALHARIADARKGLMGLTEEDVNSLMGKPMRFEFGNYRIDFLAENFLLSFSQPNFYFHATTAYDILRWKGLDIGKRDFIGQMRSLT